MIAVICGITANAWTVVLRFTGCVRVLHCKVANGLQMRVCTSLRHFLCIYKCACDCMRTSNIFACAQAKKELYVFLYSVLIMNIRSCDALGALLLINVCELCLCDYRTCNVNVNAS